MIRLFIDARFMQHSEGGALTPAGAEEKFDALLAFTQTLAFAKQAVMERTIGEVIGYCGAGPFTYRSREALEFGYRLVPGARGRGYATEAGHAVLDIARAAYSGPIFAFVDVDNHASRRVLEKLEFEFSEMTSMQGHDVELYRVDL